MFGSFVRLLPCGSWIATISLAGCLLAGPAVAQPPPDRSRDYLDQVRRQNEIAGQKMEADVRMAVREAQRLVQTDPAKAADRLRTVLAALENDTTLSSDRRESLIRMLKDRIRVAEAPPESPVPGNNKKLENTERRIEEDKKAAEEAQIQRSLDTVRDLKNLGRIEEANRLADDLARRYPDNPSVLGARRTTTTAEIMAEERKLRREGAERRLMASRDIDRSALPPKGDIDFGDPAKWREMSKRREKYTGVPLTPREKAIVQSLNTAISVRFKDSPFQDAIEYLSTYMGQPIVLDNNALKDADVGYDTPVNLQVKGLAARTVLRKILGEFNLTYVVKNETIQVTSIQKAREMMTVRSYPIGDLVSNTGLFGGTIGLQLGPGVQMAQMLQNANQIIDSIQTSVDPDSWQGNGGQGTIAFNPGTMSLVIKQSAEVHAMLGGGVR